MSKSGLYWRTFAIGMAVDGELCFLWNTLEPLIVVQHLQYKVVALTTTGVTNIRASVRVIDPKYMV